MPHTQPVNTASSDKAVQRRPARRMRVGSKARREPTNRPYGMPVAWPRRAVKAQLTHGTLRKSRYRERCQTTGEYYSSSRASMTLLSGSRKQNASGANPRAPNELVITLDTVTPLSASRLRNDVVHLRLHQIFCGEGGIRSLGTVARTHDWVAPTVRCLPSAPRLPAFPRSRARLRLRARWGRPSVSACERLRSRLANGQSVVELHRLAFAVDFLVVVEIVVVRLGLDAGQVMGERGLVRVSLPYYSSDRACRRVLLDSQASHLHGIRFMNATK